jgi:hypothetical protein
VPLLRCLTAAAVLVLRLVPALRSLPLLLLLLLQVQESHISLGVRRGPAGRVAIERAGNNNNSSSSSGCR